LNYNKLTEELKELQSKIVLDKDPISTGLNFNSQLAELQAAKERVSQILLDAIWNKQAKEIVYKKAKHDYEKAYNNTITSQEVRSLKSADLRESKTESLLVEIKDKLLQAEMDLDVANTFYKTVHHVYDLLKSKNENIVNQIRVVHTLTGLDPSVKLKINS